MEGAVSSSRNVKVWLRRLIACGIYCKIRLLWKPLGTCGWGVFPAMTPMTKIKFFIPSSVKKEKLFLKASWNCLRTALSASQGGESECGVGGGDTSTSSWGLPHPCPPPGILGSSCSVPPQPGNPPQTWERSMTGCRRDSLEAEADLGFNEGNTGERKWGGKKASWLHLEAAASLRVRGAGRRGGWSAPGPRVPCARRRACGLVMELRRRDGTSAEFSPGTNCVVECT